MTQSFCVKCGEKTNDSSSQMTKTKNGRSMRKSVCNVCGCKKCQFVSHAVELVPRRSSRLKGKGIVGDLADMFI